MWLFRKNKEKKRAIDEFNRLLSEFNSQKNDSTLLKINAFRLYDLFMRLDLNTQNEIEATKGKPLILLMKKYYNILKSEIDNDIANNNLIGIESKNVKMLCMVRDLGSSGIVFVDEKENIYVGEFLNAICRTIANEIDNDYGNKQTIYFQYMMADIESEEYIYYKNMDIIIKKIDTLIRVDDEDKELFGENEYIATQYRIDYNISKKIKLFDYEFRKNSEDDYIETMRYFLSLNKNVYLSDSEKNKISKIEKEEFEEAEKERIQREREEELKKIKYDGAMVSYYSNQEKSAGISFIDKEKFKVGDIVVDDKGRVLKIIVEWSINGLLVEEYKESITTIVRIATKEDIAKAKKEKK